ncbi:hypothetical protein QBC40DRAFT_44056 [Triangularia verruculosa]|uniref:Uncharacterized protein n=1 Tax=Triangularia verruculosa TaxID=2587418 RepID=A0AAN7AWL9_9PEZI|nr:hypothetical protein QBC40DRAFT_44056 [Triangularia verruculosa]
MRVQHMSHEPHYQQQPLWSGERRVSHVNSSFRGPFLPSISPSALPSASFSQFIRHSSRSPRKPNPSGCASLNGGCPDAMGRHQSHQPLYEHVMRQKYNDPRKLKTWLDATYPLGNYAVKVKDNRWILSLPEPLSDVSIHTNLMIEDCGN